jgi:hypothetical protein
MHRSEEREWSRCVACGADVVPATDRCFRFGVRGVICFECGVERGGSFDAQRDRWQTEPGVDDLAPLAD